MPTLYPGRVIIPKPSREMWKIWVCINFINLDFILNDRIVNAPVIDACQLEDSIDGEADRNHREQNTDESRRAVNGERRGHLAAQCAKAGFDLLEVTHSVPSYTMRKRLRRIHSRQSSDRITRMVVQLSQRDTGRPCVTIRSLAGGMSLGSASD